MRKIRASDLGKLDYCEQKVRFDAVRGDRTPDDIRRLRDAGTVAHSRFENERGKDKRCFIASCVYGVNAPQTNALRAFRDNILMPPWWGRALVAGYYRFSPFVVTFLARRPRIIAGTRRVLDSIVRRLP